MAFLLLQISDKTASGTASHEIRLLHFPQTVPSARHEFPPGKGGTDFALFFERAIDNSPQKWQNNTMNQKNAIFGHTPCFDRQGGKLTPIFDVNSDCLSLSLSLSLSL
jgi:hypothetical protein